jgi:hypothetical protein
VCCWNWPAGTHRGVLLALLIGVALAVAEPASAAQLSLSWTDNSAGTATFKVERKSGAAGGYVQIGTTDLGLTSYVDSSVTAGSTYCYRVRASNSGGDSPYSNEACGSPLGGFDLTVAKVGTGAGSVVSSPVGISCGADCFESYSPGTVVTVRTTPASGSIFVGWSGGGCSGTDPCVMARNTPVTVTATFSAAPAPPPTYTLTATKAGNGAGSITSNPAGVSCGSDCSEAYASGTTVTLSAAPADRSTFAGWSRGCSGTGSCTVTMTASTSVTATFTRKHGRRP